MRAGQLNKLITFEYQVTISDGMGGSSVTWTTKAENVWAAIWPASAKEIIAAQQETMVVTHRIRIRFRSDIKPDMRIKYGTNYFNIVSRLNPNMGNKMIDILAKEVV